MKKTNTEYQILDAMLAGSISVRLGEEAGEGKGATVASFINGIGQFGAIMEGPLIGIGWPLWSVCLPLEPSFSIKLLNNTRA